MFWRSVVGKLWFTIILLFSFVLFIHTVLLLEFFQNLQLDQAEKNLTQTANQVIGIVKHNENREDTLNIAWEAIDSATNVLVIVGDGTIYSSLPELDKKKAYQFITSDKKLNIPFNDNKRVMKTLFMPDVLGGDNITQGIIAGVPMKIDGQSGAVYTFQSLESAENKTKSTTKFILIAAGIGIFLTTIFAFFLLSRVTSPLTKMKEAAFEVSRGKFDTKVPILTTDEIGELATAFNKMARQLNYNMTALRQEKEHLSNILSSMADGVITFNRDGEILLTNPPAEIFLRFCYYDQGYSTVKGNDNQVPTPLKDLYLKVKESEKNEVEEISMQGHDWVLLMTPLYHKDNIRGAVAVLRDMTEERRLDKMRQDFIANVSHELRTPIAMLQGYSEAMIDDIAGSVEEQKEMAKIIYDESLRMGRLVNELLDLARMEAGHITLNFQDIEVGPYLKRITQKFKGLARDKGVTISAVLDNEEAVLNFDPDRIEQVFTNLVDNAIRHTNEGGTVEIIQSTRENGTVFKIKDSGTGISEEDLPFVFERFYKVDKARTRGRSGTGLGLGIAKNIVQGHEGTISVHSKLGLGTTFIFFLPTLRKNSE